MNRRYLLFIPDCFLLSMEALLKKKLGRESRDYLAITFGLICYSIGWAAFMLPYQITTGGVTGIAAIIYYATGIEIQVSYFVINAIFLGFALKILGPKFSIKTIFAIFMLTFLLWFFQMILKDENGNLPQLLGPGQDFMACVIGAGLLGFGIGIVFCNNGSTGGTDIIAAIVNKYHNISLGRVLIFVDLLIVGSSFFVFNAKPDFTTIDAVRKVVFGLCTMVIENLVLDYVMNAKRESVQFMIFSKKYQEIANAIGTQMDHGVTILDGHGWYTGDEMKVLCILAKKNESVTIFRIVKIIDPNAFVSQSAVIGVYGEGFDEMKVKIKEKDIKIIKS